MKKILLLATLGLSFGLTGCIKEYVDPYPPNGGVDTYTFVDEFYDNSNDWNFSDQLNDAYGVISDGTFKFSYLDPDGIAYYRSKDIRFNPDKDFVLETRIGSDNNMGMLFGFDQSKNAYGFSMTVSYDGYVALWDEGGNGGSTDITAIVEPFYSNAVHANGDWNDVKLVQEGNTWYGYVNGTQVFSVRASYIVKGSVGYVIVGNTRGEADYLEANFY